MTRQNFLKSVMVECAKKATREVRPGITDQYCEECHNPTKGRFEIDHVIADGLTGKPTIENARLLCVPCHKEKTATDKGNIARAKRREAGQYHVKKRPARPIAQAPKAPPKTGKIPKRPHAEIGLSNLARRFAS